MSIKRNFAQFFAICYSVYKELFSYQPAPVPYKSATGSFETGADLYGAVDT